MIPQAASGVMQNILTSETTQVYHIIGLFLLIFHDIPILFFSVCFQSSSFKTCLFVVRLTS